MTASGTVTVSVAVLVSASAVVVVVGTGEGAAVVFETCVRQDSLVTTEVPYDCAATSCTRLAGIARSAINGLIFKATMTLRQILGCGEG